MRTLALTLLISTSSCAFAVKHPAITAGIVGGTVALGSCEIASADQKACLIVTGGAGLFLGLTVAAAMWLGTEDADPEPPKPLEPLPLEPVVTPDAAPPPPAVDAGVPPVDAALVPVD